MPSDRGALQRIKDARVVAVIRSTSGAEAVQRAEALISSGLSVLEVALTTPDAADAITSIVRQHPDVLVGAGTVLDEASAHLAIRAGARFLLSPSLSLSVIRAGRRYGITVVPGVQTPTEMVTSLEAGADAVKLFPASTFGPGYLAAVRSALPQVPIIPTGGIAVAEIPAWLRAGAIAVGVGGALTDGPIETTSGHAAELKRVIEAPHTSA